MNVLVLGGAGYIGSLLCDKLVLKGYNVTVIDLLKYSTSSLSHLFFYKNFKFIKEDIRKVNILRKYTKNQDLIIPLAALVGAPLCEKKKSEAISTNLSSVKTLLKIIKPKQKLIYLTTNSGYGIGKKNKFCDEISPLNPISLYGRTKVEAENLVSKHPNHVSPD